MGAQNSAPVPHPAILLPGRTLPPFLATPDPISNVYSELGAGPAAGLGHSFPDSPLTLSDLSGTGAYEVHSKFLASLAQLRRGPQPTLPVPGLAKVVVTRQSSHQVNRGSVNSRAPVLPPARGDSLTPPVVQKPSCRQSFFAGCQDSADPQPKGIKD